MADEYEISPFVSEKDREEIPVPRFLVQALKDHIAVHRFEYDIGTPARIEWNARYNHLTEILERHK